MHRAGTVFRGLLLFSILAILAWLVAVARVPAPPAQWPTPPIAGTEPGGRLLVPVAGVARGALVDTFTQARDRGRPHDAIDIAAPRGTLVVAAADGWVEKLFFSRGGGGITAYVRSPDGRRIYYYAHLEGHARGLREGQRMRRGDPIGRVGSTGNANPSAPHLHFAIHAVGPSERWWEGRPVNPYPLLAAPRRRR